MHRGLRVSVVIPTRNEARGIAAVLTGLPSCVDEALVVDYRSDDGTVQTARKLGARVIEEPKKGYGRAYLTGVPAAEGEIVVTLDADGTYPSERIPTLVDELEQRGLLFISCARFPLADPRSMRPVNQVGNAALTFMGNVVYGVHLRDLLSGMWVLRREVWTRLRPRAEDWNLSQEIKLRAALGLGARFAEVGIPYAPRLGESKLAPFAVGAENLRHLFAERERILAEAREIREAS